MRVVETRTTDDPPQAEASADRDLRVLIADDSAVTRRVMSALVSTIAPGVEIVEAGNGADTCEALRRGPFDAAFVDFHMPDMSGPRAVSLARRVGADPLVVVMGDTPEDAADRTLRSIDPYEFMQKPLEERELRQVLGAVSRMREPARVMIVDDSKAARRLMGKVLEASRFAMDIAAVDSGEAALKRLKDEPCDVVFLDYAMPGIDGLETACLVQELMPEVRVVMVSASQNPAVEKAARYFGAVHFLRKPFFAREVDKAMHLALDLPLTSFMQEPDEAESDQLELALFE
ncbi:MAG TPA: response regulator [Beijerinckiaceae bacterium]|jgi:CheY-like chemotaxis protein